MGQTKDFAPLNGGYKLRRFFAEKPDKSELKQLEKEACSEFYIN